MTRESRINVRNLRVVAPLVGVLAMMGVLMYYAVPLYNMFCQVTGIGGTTQRATAADVQQPTSNQTITIRFAAEIQPDLPWSFKPETRSAEITLGEPKTFFFRARNNADREIVTHAAYNVTPLKVGQYVNKIECFCFTEERLGPGESVRMPVQVFIDPEMMADSTVDEVRTITLSYHLFESANPEGAKDLKRLDTPKDSESTVDGASAASGQS
jgi:cytochrome c oxidase assembly protein Cox11